MESIRSELMELQQTCRCMRGSRGDEEESRKRQHVALHDEEETGQPAQKRGQRSRSRWSDEGGSLNPLFLFFDLLSPQWF